MQSKTTTKTANPQNLIAGLIEGSGIEFFGIHETKKVKWLQNGLVKTFDELPPAAFGCLLNAYRKNKRAKQVISTEAKELKRQVELYAYYSYGALDNKPDMVDGILQEAENFRHTRNCVSLKFKQLKIEGQPLKPREIEIIDQYIDEAEFKDEVVATGMGITRSTLSQHKAGLYRKAGVFSRSGLVRTAFKNRLTVR